MEPDILITQIGPFVVLGSLLAGFSFSVVFQLYSSQDQRWITTATAICFLVSTLCFLVAVIGGTLILLGDAIDAEVQDVADLTTPFLYFGILSLMGGLAVGGWMRSKETGIVSTILSIFATIIMAIAFAQATQ